MAGKYTQKAVDHFKRAIPGRAKGKNIALRRIREASRPMEVAKAQVKWIKLHTPAAVVKDDGHQFIYEIPLHTVGDPIPPKPVRVEDPVADPWAVDPSDVQELCVRYGRFPSDGSTRLIAMLARDVSSDAITSKADWNDRVAAIKTAARHNRPVNPREKKLMDLLDTTEGEARKAIIKGWIRDGKLPGDPVRVDEPERKIME